MAHTAQQMETYYRTSTQELMQRCRDCWQSRDAYPHLDNGFVVVSQPYQHARWCKAE